MDLGFGSTCQIPRMHREISKMVRILCAALSDLQLEGAKQCIMALVAVSCLSPTAVSETRPINQDVSDCCVTGSAKHLMYCQYKLRHSDTDHNVLSAIRTQRYKGVGKKFSREGLTTICVGFSSHEGERFLVASMAKMKEFAGHGAWPSPANGCLRL